MKDWDLSAEWEAGGSFCRGTFADGLVLVEVRHWWVVMHSEPFGCGMMHWVEIKNNNNNNNAGISISPSRSWVLSLCLWCTGSPCRVKAGEPPAGWGSAACALLGAARELQTAPHVTVCISDDHWTTLPAASCSSSAARELLSSFPSLPPPSTPNA